DIGGLSLAMAVVLGASAVLMERNLIGAALAGYTVYAASHLLFHATHTGGLPATDAAALLTGLSLLPALTLGLLVLASRAGSPPGRVSAPTPDGTGSTAAGRDNRARSRGQAGTRRLPGATAGQAPRAGRPGRAARTHTHASPTARGVGIPARLRRRQRRMHQGSTRSSQCVNDRPESDTPPPLCCHSGDVQAARSFRANGGADQ